MSPSHGESRRFNPYSAHDDDDGRSRTGRSCFRRYLDDDALPANLSPVPAVNERDARIQKWAIIAFAIIEALIIALVVIVRIRGG